MGGDRQLKTIREIKDQGPYSLTIGPFGSRMKSDCYTSTGVPVIRGTNITSGRIFSGEFVYISEAKANELIACNVFKDDLVFPHRGAIGEVGIVTNEEKYVISSSLMKLRCNPEIAYPLFVYYFFKSPQGKHELLKNASQVGTPGIAQPLSSLGKIEIPLPSLGEQILIANILSSLDDKIEINRRINRTLEETAQGLFRSWFVDFDPVKAKARANELGCDPERAAMAAIAGKLRVPKDPEELTAEDFTAAETVLASLTDEQRAELAETAALFPAALVESELGLIPEGWEVRTLADIANFVNGRNFTKNATGNGRIVIRIAELNSGIGNSTQFNEVKAQIENIATPDTILFAWSGSLGVHRWHREEALINQHIFKVIPTDIPDWFAYFQLVEHMSFFRSVASHKAVTMGHIKRSHLSEALLAYPVNSDLVKAATIRIQPLYDRIHILTKESDTLTLLRDTLLPKLLSGELSVDGIESLPDIQTTV